MGGDEEKGDGKETIGASETMWKIVDSGIRLCFSPVNVASDTSNSSHFWTIAMALRGGGEKNLEMILDT